MPRGGRREGAGRKPLAQGGAVSFTVTMPKKLQERLDEAARCIGETRSGYISRAVEERLENAKEAS